MPPTWSFQRQTNRHAHGRLLAQVLDCPPAASSRASPTAPYASSHWAFSSWHAAFIALRVGFAAVALGGRRTGNYERHRPETTTLYVVVRDKRRDAVRGGGRGLRRSGAATVRAP